MKVLLTIWISAVLIQEVFPSTLVRLPRQASNKTSLVHTEYEAKYEQKGKHGNESFSSVSGKQHFMHDNCSENWNAFAEKCASLIKDLVASLANVVTSKPGDATNLQLHIKNTFRHFDNTHNCTCLNHSGQGLSDIDLSPLFNNITINTVGPATNGVGGSGSGTNNVLQNNCGGGHSCGEENDSHLEPVVVSPSSNTNGGDSSKPDHNQSQKCSDESCAGHDKNAEKGTEEQATGDPTDIPRTRRISNALVDSKNRDMHPSTTGNSNDESTTNGRRQAKYPQVSRQPKNLIYSSGDSDYLIYPEHPKNSKQILQPFLVTPRPSYRAKFSQASVDPISALGRSPNLSLPEDKSSSSALDSPVSSLIIGNDTPSFASHLVPSPGDSEKSPNLPSDFENAAPNYSGISQQSTQTEITSPIVTPNNPMAGNENKLPAQVFNSHNSLPVTTQNSKPEGVESLIKLHNIQPSLTAPTGPPTENLNKARVVIVPIETNGDKSGLSVVVPVKKTVPLTMTPETNSNSNLPESSVPECDEVKSVNPSPTYEPLPTGPSPNPSSKVVAGKNPAILPPEEDCPPNNENGVADNQSGSSGNLGEPMSNQGVIAVTSNPVFPLNSAKGQEQPNQEVLIVTPIPAKTLVDAPMIDQYKAKGPGNSGPAGDPYAKNSNNWHPIENIAPATSGEEEQQRNGALPIRAAETTTPFFIHPVKPLPASVQPNAGSVEPDDCKSENQQPQVNLLTTPIPFYPVKTIPAIPADMDKQQRGNPTDSSGNNNQEWGNEFPQVNKMPESLSQQGSGDDCKDEKAPSNNNLVTNNPGTVFTGAKEEQGTTLTVLELVKPAVLPNSEVQGEVPMGHPTQSLGKPDPLVQQGLSDPLEQGANPLSLTPPLSGPDVIPTILQSVKPPEGPECESQTGEGNPSAPLDQSALKSPLGLSSQSGPGDGPTGLAPTPSDPSVIPTLLQSVKPPEGPDCESQTGEGNPSAPLDQSALKGPLGLSSQSGPGDGPTGLAPTPSDPSVIPTLLQSVKPPEGPDCESQTGEGNPLGPSDQPGQLAIPIASTPAQSGHAPGIAELIKPVAVAPIAQGKGESVAPLGQPVATLGNLDQEAIPADMKPEKNGITPVFAKPVTLAPKGNEQFGEIPVLIRPTTFQTTSVEPTAPPALPGKGTKPTPEALVPQDSYETLPGKPSTSPKAPAPRDDDDDDDEDCCSCESCTEEEITDPKKFKENACRNLEEARKELKLIFDKIKKKLKCGRKAPRTITTQTVS